MTRPNTKANRFSYSGLAYKASAALREYEVKTFRCDSRSAAEKIRKKNSLRGVDTRFQRWVVYFAGQTALVSDSELVAIALDMMTTKTLTIFDGRI